jgi:ribosomal protein S18 acetylase RimI-like enzyme
VEPAAGPGLWYAKVDVAEPAAVARLEERGFRVVDVNVTLRREGGAAQNDSWGDVGPATPDEHERLIEIAGRCFHYSRFHLDPEIPNELADSVKREWVRSYVQGRRGIELLAARDGVRPVGFLAVLESGPARVIDLVGVDPAYQRRGVGNALVSAFVRQHGPEADELLVGTQIANVPSLRLYARKGFAVDRAAYVLHRHGAVR